ncbi:UNVERIFIED_CONTAM: hypothetical protein Sangu_2724100 [Sesamum angustifolium]|uniref:Uncharacterized protein n=1 Tax=Sesamum angustifolium TaxID=2727405 RepID=A0AAW2IWJ1_9LAMI
MASGVTVVWLNVEQSALFTTGFLFGSDVHSSRSSESWIERVLVSDTETSSYDPNVENKK